MNILRTQFNITINQLFIDVFFDCLYRQINTIHNKSRLDVLPNATNKKGITPGCVIQPPEQGPQLLRHYLKSWLDKPKTYSYRLRCLSRLFKRAVDAILLRKNIDSRASKGRDVYMSDDDYLAITDKQTEDFHWLYAHCGLAVFNVRLAHQYARGAGGVNIR